MKVFFKNPDTSTAILLFCLLLWKSTFTGQNKSCLLCLPILVSYYVTSYRKKPFTVTQIYLQDVEH